MGFFVEGSRWADPQRIDLGWLGVELMLMFDQQTLSLIDKYWHQCPRVIRLQIAPFMRWGKRDLWFKQEPAREEELLNYLEYLSDFLAIMRLFSQTCYGAV